MTQVVISKTLERAFDVLHQRLGRPAVYAVPYQVPTGLSYDADYDQWTDADGNRVDASLYTSSLTNTAIPALWGADADVFVLGMGGIERSGDLVVVARAIYQSSLDGAMMVVTGSMSGDKYNVTNVENAPDGSSDPVFVVARLSRREA